MMNNNKILTVSYGTFSCTLEGFDDSFGTMKAIAEYFRDLAADDRYFGAEPPQPDAEMLARIAQKEISRKVQARERDGKIVLSALEDQRQTAEPPFVEGRAAQKAAAQQTVAQAPAAPAVAIKREQDDAPIPAKAAPPPATESEVETALQTEEDDTDIVPGQPDAEVEAFFAASPSQNTYGEDDEIAPRSATVGGIDNIAAKLQRIRAVVARNTEATDQDYVEDQVYGEVVSEDVASDLEANLKTDAPSASARVLTAAREEVEDALAYDDAVELASREIQNADRRTAIVEDEGEIEPENDSEMAAEANTGTIVIAKEEEEDDEDDMDAILGRLSRATAEGAKPPKENTTAIRDDRPENLFEDTLDGGEEETLERAVRMTAAVSDTPRRSAPQTAVDAAPRARVIKVKRADLEAAIQKGTLEEYDEDERDDARADAPRKPRLDDLAPAKSAATSLSPEDEEALARELAELEDDIDEDNESTRRTEAPRQAQKRDLRKRADPGTLDRTRDTDVNRLLAEADHQMDEPESATRRDAFTHLRAAVAAKKADVAMGSSVRDDTEDDAYRSDLADVVRPRRPAGGTQRTARPPEGRPAPLKLVAEQRIDVERARAAGPVRPRRVSAVADVDSPDAAENFADYAAEMGASTLPQLLEAAASYMSFVEGHDQFSRPQLMTKVRQASGQSDFSREDGLRFFGQLLRTGKISKIKGGRFTVSEDIGFRPDQRAAG